ncbi:TadE/TadG family type IV pilus assembly protein [uncultured Devosia sp.]|uniref:TadE/TadG family type IV pilus assembly protein n=1 Tax=uncultured Devosia sp. TaxID=211434 RepID=UPI002624E8A9|nr:TadE/TadG family type IV pilus assembly protein [uncultured Devosia sp.]
MTQFVPLLRQFAKDESGVFAVLFGLMAIVLIALGGATVDYVTLEQTRQRAQLALDAAALALQPEIFKPGYSDANVEAAALAIVKERVSDPRIVDSIDIVQVVANPTDGSLYFAGTFTMPTMFVSLVGVPQLSAGFEAEATRKKLALEVVMVLDNSGSMASDSRMTNLVAAAKCATNILMYTDTVDSGNTCIPAPGATLVDDVKVGIVPFTMYVNVGTGNANASWIDRYGNSVIANDNFDNDDNENSGVLSLSGYSFPNIFDLFSATGENWRGCVVARPHIKTGTMASEYLDTDDTAPTGANTLFVPLFSPDMVDGVGTNNYVNDSPAVCDRPSQGGATCTQTESRTCYWWGCTGSNYSSSPTGGPTNFTSTSKFAKGIYGERPSSCGCRNWGSWSGWSTSGSTQSRTRTCSGGGYIPEGLSPRELQERVCKYYAGVSNSSFSRGPNADCTRTAILPLTTNPTTVINTINGMQAEGGTNIHMGTVWGFRALSPTAPFTEGGPYDQATSKVMIVMTDGENTAYNFCGGTQGSLNGNCYHSAYGFQYNSNNTSSVSTSGGNIPRMGNPSNVANATLVTEMNQRTLDSCANAKAAGISIYTIGLATDTVTQSTPQTVRNMLTNCASVASNAKFPASPSELKSTFEDIANDLSALRLAR